MQGPEAGRPKLGHDGRSSSHSKHDVVGCKEKGGERVLVGLTVFKTVGGPFGLAVGSIPTPLRHVAAHIMTCCGASPCLPTPYGGERPDQFEERM